MATDPDCVRRLRELVENGAVPPESLRAELTVVAADVLREYDRILFTLDTERACQRDRDRLRNDEASAYRRAAETLRAECADLREQLKSTAKDRDDARADVARLARERDRAVAKARQLARIITNEATTQDAVELLSAALLQDAASAPNCMEWRGDYGGRGFSVSVQWADGQSPHALIDEARRERDEARAILEGRTAPPTDAEIDAHHAAGGSWLTGDTVTWWPASLRGMRDNGETEGCVWIALDRSYRPCAWPRPGGGT